LWPWTLDSCSSSIVNIDRCVDLIGVVATVNSSSIQSYWVCLICCLMIGCCELWHHRLRHVHSVVTAVVGVSTELLIWEGTWRWSRYISTLWHRTVYTYSVKWFPWCTKKILRWNLDLESCGLQQTPASYVHASVLWDWTWEISSDLNEWSTQNLQRDILDNDISLLEQTILCTIFCTANYGRKNQWCQSKRKTTKSLDWWSQGLDTIEKLQWIEKNCRGQDNLERLGSSTFYLRRRHKKKKKKKNKQMTNANACRVLSTVADRWWGRS